MFEPNSTDFDKSVVFESNTTDVSQIPQIRCPSMGSLDFLFTYLHAGIELLILYCGLASQCINVNDDHKAAFENRNIHNIEEGEETCQCLVSRMVSVAARSKVAISWPASFATCH